MVALFISLKLGYCHLIFKMLFFDFNNFIHEELRKTLRILIQPRNVAVQEPDKDGPIAQLLLFNNAIARYLVVL